MRLTGARWSLVLKLCSLVCPQQTACEMETVAAAQEAPNKQPFTVTVETKDPGWEKQVGALYA